MLRMSIFIARLQHVNVHKLLHVCSPNIQADLLFSLLFYERKIDISNKILNSIAYLERSSRLHDACSRLLSLWRVTGQTCWETQARKYGNGTLRTRISITHPSAKGAQFWWVGGLQMFFLFPKVLTKWSS